MSRFASGRRIPVDPKESWSTNTVAQNTMGEGQVKELSDSMRRLIGSWELDVPVGDSVRVQVFPPLVDMLHSLVVPSNNSRGGGGAANTRNLIDAKSLDLLIHIQDVTRAWLQEWGVQGAGELKLDLRGFWEKLHSLHRSGAMDDDTFDHLAAYPDTWATKIWDLIEPPHQVPLRGTVCPRCEVGKVVNGDGDSSDNVLITIRVGHAPTAECRNGDCGATWVGRDDLIELGRAVGVEVDIDALMEVVAEMSTDAL